MTRILLTLTLILPCWAFAQTADDDDLAMANAIAMTEAEPW